MSDISIRQQLVKDEFSSCKDWEDRYKHLVEIGRALPELAEQDKKEDNLVRGCQSQVWLVTDLTPEGKIHFRGDSDAVLVRGLVALLLRVYSDATPDEILSSSPQFLKEIGFEQNLTPSRSNGLFSMLKQIRNYALAYKAMLDAKR
jgi:cysteine desulfuration protein SufE